MIIGIGDMHFGFMRCLDWLVAWYFSYCTLAALKLQNLYHPKSLITYPTY